MPTSMNFNQALEKFLTHITAVSKANHTENYSLIPPSTYRTMVGKKNIRIVTLDDSGKDKSVFCFIRIEDGAVLMAAGWKAPAKTARGTIFTDDPNEYGVTHYGARYL